MLGPTEFVQDWHIIPIRDLGPHAESRSCQCNPYWESNNRGGWIVVHRSYDGRELGEPDSNSLAFRSN